MQSNKTIIITAALLILTILAAGCISTNSSSQTTYQQTNVPEEVIDTQPVEVAPVEDVSVVAEPVVDNWWDGKEGYQEGTYTTMFGTEVDAVKYMMSDGRSYNLFDIKTGALMGDHVELDASQLNLDRELQPAQYKALVAEYGTPVHVTMETIDDDPNHAGMDHVAVKYVGSKGVAELITDYDGFDGVGHYISAGIYYGLFK